MKKYYKESKYWIIIVFIIITSCALFGQWGDTATHKLWGYDMLSARTRVSGFWEWIDAVLTIRAYPLWPLFFGIVADGMCYLVRHILGISAEIPVVRNYSIEQICDIVAGCLCESFCLLLTIYITWKALQILVPKISKNKLLAIALLISFWGPIGRITKYQSIRVSVWQSATLMAIEGCALICFFLYYYLYTRRDKLSVEFLLLFRKIKINKLMLVFNLFAIFMVISALLKPNFYQIFVPAMFFFCIFDLIESKGKQFKFDLMSGCSLIPLFFVLLIQYHYTFSDGTYGGVCLDPLRVAGGWAAFYYTIPVSFAFLIFWGIIYYKKIVVDKLYFLAFLTFLSALGQWLMLRTVNDFWQNNFMWGVCIANRILIVVSISRFLNYENLYSWKRKLGKIIIFAHILGGIFYWLIDIGIAWKIISSR